MPPWLEGAGIRLVLGVTLLLALSCGGGTGSRAPGALATGLTYSDPATTGWRLTLNQALSTPTQVVLDLQAPAGTQGLGAGFLLTTDATRVAWVQVDAADEDQVHNIAYDLGAYPHLSLGLARGDTLGVGLFQRGGVAAVPYDGPILQVALAFRPRAGLRPGDPIPLAVTKAVHRTDSGRSTMAIACGELRAR